MVSNDYLIFAVVNSDHDFKNVDGAPAAQYRYPFYTANMSSTASDPKIDYVLGGYGNDVIGLASANIGEINGVASGDISELNGL